MNKHNLEETIKEKVSLLLEETMEKSWGIYVPQIESDITDKLQSSIPIKFYVSSRLSFQEAKKKFKFEFLKSQFRLHQGNISQIAKFIGLERRSVHRIIKDLGIRRDQIRREQGLPLASPAAQQEIFIDQTIRSALNNYREIIRPQKMERMYKEVPALSRNLAKILPYHHLTWKQAELDFEKQFLHKSLAENDWKITKTAQKIKIQPETLHRKIVKLTLQK